jgi:hypothetical protein
MLKRSTSMSIYSAYTYFLHHKPTNTYYYGVRWQNIKLKRTPEQDFWKLYFTRSSRVKYLIEKYGKDTFEFEIRKMFCNSQLARKWETKVLRRMKVLAKPDIWINRTDNKAIMNEVHPRGTLGKTWKRPDLISKNKLSMNKNQFTKNTFWVNNGIERRMIPVGTKIPTGFVKGTGRTNKRPDLAERNRRGR